RYIPPFSQFMGHDVEFGLMLAAIRQIHRHKISPWPKSAHDPDSRAVGETIARGFGVLRIESLNAASGRGHGASIRLFDREAHGAGVIELIAKFERFPRLDFK